MQILAPLVIIPFSLTHYEMNANMSSIPIISILQAILYVYAFTTGYIYIEYVQFLILRQRLLSDRLLAFTLEHLLTNSEVLGFLWPLYFAYLMEKSEEEYLQSYIMSSGDSIWSRINYTVAFLQILFHYLFRRRRQLYMINALRFVDPTWDKAPHGHRLGPSILYLLGLRLYPIQTEESVSQVTAGEEGQGGN